jgi:hypothetical protein
MLVYHYDAATGEYLDATTAQESPLETGVFLLPAYATTIAPPDATTGCARIWDGSAWGQAEDHRGEQGYVDGVAATVTELGALPDGWSVNAPEPTEAQATAAKQAEIATGAEAALASLKAEYCATEITTWDQQYAEATAFTADAAASVPLLSAIATARGMTVVTLASKIIANRASWVVIAGSVVGQRLAYQDALGAATTVAEIQAISVSYTLPES